MEDAKKRWSVTYTKHIRQKRKVYQDGFLDLYASTNKVKLYDEFEKLLECKILKNDEVVSSGETLTFSSYLVDLGDPEGNHKPVQDLNSRGKKVSERPKFPCRQKFGSTFVSSDRKTDVEKKYVQPGSSSPSKRIIREFKRRELKKYTTSPNNPDAMNAGMTEWQVLHTTQVTQKAKKYHDGFLQLTPCGSLGRQIKLFDETRRLLDSRFLKRDEVIKCGEPISFCGHLVEVGECEGNIKLQSDLKLQGNNCNSSLKSEGMQGNEVCSKRSLNNKKEWQAMCTTQVTQKAKRYHDGFLQLASNGSLQGQVMLYDDSRRLLDSRFLKKDEVIKSGESVAFDAHLVDIGEPHGKHLLEMDGNTQVDNVNVFERSGMLRGQQNHLKANKSFGKPQNSVCPRESIDPTLSISRVNETKLSKSVSTDKPVRDAFQIISILQKPMAPESVAVEVQLSSTKGFEVSRAVEDVCDGNQSPVPDCGSCENLDNNNHSDLASSKSVSVEGGSLVSKDAEFGKCDQAYADEKAGTNQKDEAFVSGIISSGACASSGPSNSKSISSKQHKTATTMDEFPSFDLGL